MISFVLLIQKVQWISREPDDDIWQCTCNILHVDLVQVRSVKDFASLPLVLGGVGLRSAERVRVSAFWASWADCIPIITRHIVAVVLEGAWSLNGF